MFPDVQNPNPGANQQPQQAANGQYAVVPPIQAMPNNGHSGHNPYEFIVNPAQQKKKGGLGGGDPFLKKIGILVGGVILFMIVAAVVISALAPKTDNTTSLTGIAEAQQEVVRVATLGAAQASDQSTKNFATNVELGVGTDQVKLLAYLAQKGTKLNAKQLALKHTAQTDTLLTNATATNTFDTVVTQNLTGQLNDYANSIANAYKLTKSTALKQLLNQDYKNAKLLLQQAKNTSTTSS